MKDFLILAFISFPVLAIVSGLILDWLYKRECKKIHKSNRLGINEVVTVLVLPLAAMDTKHPPSFSQIVTSATGDGDRSTKDFYLFGLGLADGSVWGYVRCVDAWRKIT